MTLAMLCPQIRTMLDEAVRAGAPAWSAVSVERARTMFLDGATASAGAAPELRAVQDISIPGSPHGPIAARLYSPDAAVLRPTLLYFHGGGFVLGSLDSHDALCRHISAASGAQVLSIGYRLAPEYKFPAALEDALAAARWLLSHCDTINADPKRLAIGGDSAGANLATTACRLLDPMFRYQMLIYPMTDLGLRHPSIEMFRDGYRLTREILEWFMQSYLPVGELASDPRVSPLLADDLSALPPAIVLTAGFDPLRDEGQAYSEALSRAGVASEHVCFEDMIHGFCNMPGTIKRAHEAYALLGERLAGALSLSTTGPA